MSGNITHVRQVAAGVALAASCLVGFAATGAAAQASPALAIASARGDLPSAGPGSQLWLQRYNGSGNGSDSAQAMAVSPDGTKVFVTGSSDGGLATVAYRAATGARLWLTQTGGEVAASIAVSPDGSTVFLAADGQRGGPDMVTRAFSAATGTVRWTVRFSQGSDYASSVTVSPDGGTVFVAGTSEHDYATVAYRAATGARLWVARYNGGGADYASAMGISPDGRSLYVTGQSWGGAGTKNDYVTVAYGTATGARLWTARYTSSGANGDYARALTVGPGGTRVYVTGESSGNYATVAYGASTGTRLWVRRYNGPGNGLESANAIAAGPGGATVYVTGSSRGVSTGLDYATIAYRAKTGEQLWVQRYNGTDGGLDRANAIAVSPARTRVYVTGDSAGVTSNFDYATVAYAATTGGQLWTRRYNGPGNGFDYPRVVAVTPGGSVIFVTGLSTGTGQGEEGFDYATIAYRG